MNNRSPLKTIILAGHNNAANWGPMQTTDLPPALRNGVPGVLVWTDGAWKKLDSATLARRFGPETTLAAELKTTLGDDLGVILVKQGNTSLAVDWAPDTGPMFQQLLAEVSAARAARPLDIVGFAWVNGLRDDTPEFAAVYAANQRAFVARLRAEFANPGMRYVTILEPTVSETLRAAQAAAAQIPGCAVVDTKDLPRPDPWHYNPEGQVKLGSLLGAQLNRLLAARP